MIKSIALSVGGLMSLFSTAYGVVWFTDARYAPMAALEDIQWNDLKEAIRDIKRDIKDDPDNDELWEDLEVYIDKLCRAFPDDRECEDAQ